MIMEIRGNWNQGQAQDLKRLQEESLKTEELKAEQKEKEQEKEQEKTKKAEKDASRDLYIGSEESHLQSRGLYRLGQDENGNRKIYFEDPEKVNPENEEEPSGTREPQAKEKAADPEKAEEKWMGNTDKVDREIRKLKEKKKQLEQQIQKASGDEKKIQELEKQLEQVERELRQKDNDGYRRQHTSMTRLE